MNNHLPNPSPGPRLYELDALRGLAAVYVMLSHYLHDCARMYDGNAVTLLTLPFSGQYAVHLFFVISGFVIFMTLQRCRNTADFILNRVGRLFPAYLIAVVGTTLVSMWLSEYDIKPPVTLTQFAANLTMMHSFLGDIPAIDGVYWSLMVELAFYFWMGLLFAGGLLRRIELVAWLWLVVALENSSGPIPRN